ncbi:hypothetical protein NMG60_11016752 [Bertholletia excelsa]
MAAKHRRLFPNLASANQTADCSGYCDPYYYNPDWSSPPLPPPPPPPPPPLALAAQNSQIVSPYVIVAVALLAGLFLLVSYYVVIVKYCSGWSRSRQPPTQPNDEILDENNGPAVDHPIWYINTIGLQPSVIDSITVFRYKKTDPLVEARECSVCLNEFRDDETLRLLPKCNHAFHIPCIDTWLRSHTNCPLCRARIVSNTAGTPSGSNNQNGPNSDPGEETQMGNSEELGENRAEAEVEIEVQQVDDARKGSCDSSESVNNVMRRSVSMNSSSVVGISLDGGEDVRDHENRAVNEGPSTEESLQKTAVSMNRSFSLGGRLFLSRHNRNSSSILPL